MSRVAQIGCPPQRRASALGHRSTTLLLDNPFAKVTKPEFLRLARDVADDPLRKSLDAMCRGLSPPPVDLAAERAEHVLMYQLLGDPLLRLRRSEASIAQSPTDQPVAR